MDQCVKIYFKNGVVARALVYVFYLLDFLLRFTGYQYHFL